MVCPFCNRPTHPNNLYNLQKKGHNWTLFWNRLDNPNNLDHLQQYSQTKIFLLATGQLIHKIWIICEKKNYQNGSQLVDQPKWSEWFAKIFSEWTAHHFHMQKIAVCACFSTMQAGSWVERGWGRRGISNVAKENAWKFHFGTNYGLQLKQICCTMGGRYLPLFALEKVPWLKSPCGGRG